MKRVLSLVLALVMVLGTIVPAFAEETMTKTPGEELKGYGLIDGTDKGLEEDKPLQRAEMAVILAKMYGKAEEAKTYALPSSFTDVDKDAWYAPWVAYAQAQKWMVGADSKFRPMDNLSAQEINVLMVKVLGYEAKWETANEDAATYKVAVDAKDKSLVLRGEIFKAMTTTLDQPKKGETETLGTALKLTGYTAPTPAIPEKLEVAKVMTDNLKTIVVEFNQELNKKTVVKDNFAVSGYTIADVKLGEDKKTVTIIINEADGIAQSKEVELTVKAKIKDITDKKTIAEFKQKYIVNDVTIPVIENLTVVDAKHVKIQASEPMNWSYTAFTVLPGVKLDGNSVVGKVVADHQNHTYTIEFNSVKKEGSYKLSIEGIKDFAKLSAVKKEFSFDIAKDDKAPVATKAEMKATTEVWVTFDEPLTTAGTITINGKDTTETFADATNKVVKAVLAPADKLSLGATVEVIVKYKGQKDVVGNEVKTDTTLTFKVEDDTTLPTASIEVQKANKVVITFSKAMDVTLGKLIVKDKDAKVLEENTISGLGTWNTEKTVLTLTAAQLDAPTFKLSDTNPVDIKIELKDMKDSTVRANGLAASDMTISLLDTKKPVVQPNYITKTGTKTDKSDETVTFFFSEMMDEDSIKNLSNYLKGSDSFAAETGVSVKSVAADKKSITITYPNAVAKLTGNLSVVAVKDVAGNMADSKLDVAVGNAATTLKLATVVADRAVATKTTQVVVEFNLPIKSVDPAAISILNTDNTAKTTVSSIAKIDGTKVTLNLVDALTTKSGDFKVKIANKSLIKSTYDTTFDADTSAIVEATITDKVAPVVKAMTDGDTAGAKKNNATIEFTEIVTWDDAKIKNFLRVELNGNIVPADKYAVAGKDTTKMTITVDPGQFSLTDGKYKLEVFLTNVADATNGGITEKTTTTNVVALFNKSITDFDYDSVLPTITSVSTADTDKDGKIEYTITFSKPIVDTSLTVAEFEVGDTDVVVDAGTDLTGTGTTANDNVYIIETNVVDTAAMAIEYDGTTLADALGFKFAAKTVTDTTDTVAPIMVSAETASATTVVITYSENVSTTTAGATDWVYDADGAGAGAAAVTASVAATDGTAKTVTLTLPGGTFSTGTAVPAATITYTQAANDIDDGVTATAGTAAVTPQTITGVTSGF